MHCWDGIVFKKITVTKQIRGASKKGSCGTQKKSANSSDEPISTQALQGKQTRSAQQTQSGFRNLPVLMRTTMALSQYQIPRVFVSIRGELRYIDEKHAPTRVHTRFAKIFLC
jgi:hypothetical protein